MKSFWEKYRGSTPTIYKADIKDIQENVYNVLRENSLIYKINIFHLNILWNNLLPWKKWI